MDARASGSRPVTVATAATPVQRFRPQAIVHCANTCPVCGQWESPASFLNHNIRYHGVKFTELRDDGRATILMRLQDLRLGETKCVRAIAYEGSGVEALGNINLPEEYEHLSNIAPIIYWARLDERPGAGNGIGPKEHFVTFALGAVPTTGVLVLDLRVVEMVEELFKLDEVDLFYNSPEPKKQIHVEMQTKNFMEVQTVQFWTASVDTNKTLVLDIALRGFPLPPAVGRQTAQIQ